MQALSDAALATEERAAAQYECACTAAKQRLAEEREEDAAAAEASSRAVGLDAAEMAAAEVDAAERLASVTADLEAARVALRATETRAEEDHAASAKSMAAQAKKLSAAEAEETKAARANEKLRITEVNISEAAAAREVRPL